MSDQIKISHEALKTEIRVLTDAFSVLGEGSNTFIQGASGCLDGFNSDFATQSKKTLDDLAGKFVPGLFTKTEKFYYALIDTVNAFEGIDRQFTEQIMQGMGQGGDQ